MSKCYTYNGVTYTSKQLYDKIRYELQHNPELSYLKGIILNTQDDVMGLIRTAHTKGKSNWSVRSWIGVSEFIDLEHNLGIRNGVVNRQHLSPAYDRESRIANSIEKMLMRPEIGGSVEKARQAIEKQMEVEDTISDFGEIVHGLIEVAVKARIASIERGLRTTGVNSQEFSNALIEVKDKIEHSEAYTDKNGINHASLMEVLTQSEASKSTIDEIMEKLKTIVSNVEDNVFNGRQVGTKFFSEYEIGTNEIIGDIKDKAGNVISGVKGKIDLLVINPDGSVEVCDFKVASRPFQDWYAAKVYHTDYQLGTYRAILAANGIDGRNVTLKVQPIFFPLGKVSQMQVQYSQNRTASSRQDPSKLDWDDGKFTNNLRYLISTIIKPLTSDNVSLDTDIQEEIANVLGKYETEEDRQRKYSKEDIISSIWPSQYRGKTVYNLFDRVTGKKITKDTKEEFTKEGGYIDEMLNRMKNFYNNQIKSLVADIKKYQNESNSSEKFDLLSASSGADLNVYNVLQGTFGKYCNPSWTLIEIPELLDLGIFVFQHKTSGIYDVVRVTKDNLRLSVSNNGTSTVLGKFISTEQAGRISEFKPLESSIANIQLMETMCALNILATQFRNGRLGSLKIINPQIGQSEVPSIEQLKSNFAFLTSKANLENNFDSIIRTATTWEIFQEDLKALVANPSILENLRSAVSNANMDESTIKSKIDSITRLMHKLEDEFPATLKYHDFKSDREFNAPEQKVYYALSLALLYYKDTPIRYDGKLSKWGLHFEEAIRVLGLPLMSEYKSTLNNGYKAIGLGQGLDMSTPTSSPSSNLSALYQFWDTAFQHIRDTQLKQQNFLNALCLEYEQRKTSQLQRALINTTDIWSDLIEKGPDGEFTKELKLLNPYDRNLNLDPRDEKFLKEILWEMQKYILKGITEEQRSWHYKDHESEILDIPSVIDAISEGTYFQLPLRRSSSFERLHHITKIGLKQAVSKMWDSLKDEYDPRQLHSSAQSRISSESAKDVTKMYNQYSISQRAREDIIASEGVYDFELDLNLLAGDISFQFERKRLFDDALVHTNAMVTVMHYLQQTSDANFEEELENIDNQTKISLKNETVIPKELQDAAKGISLAKRLNSLIVLSIRPLQFLKELTFGQFTNYSRAWALQGTNQKVSASNIFKANSLVWGKQIAGWLDTLAGNSDLAAFTLVQVINKTYGIANEDLNTIVEKNSLQRTGIQRGLSKYLYIFNSAPDFFNRMTLFIGKMLEDGCFDAHHLDKDGNLVYDITKDKRFSKLVQHGLDFQTTDKEYLEQRALYRVLVEQFQKEGFTKPNGEILSTEELYLPRAYTVKQKQALKEISDMAYGFYDHEARSLNDHKFFGLVFKQFMAFWTAKTTLWFRGPGANTAQGAFVPMLRDGKQVYRRVYEDPTTGKLQVELTTENPNGDLEPQYIWQGEYVEGLAYSIGYTLRDIFTANWSDIIGNKQRLGNLKLALHDIIIGIILFNILKMIFSGGTGKMNDVQPAERMLLRAMQDTSPSAIFGLSITPSFVSTLENIRNDIPDLLSGDLSQADMIRRRFGSLKDITWEQH